MHPELIWHITCGGCAGEQPYPNALSPRSSPAAPWLTKLTEPHHLYYYFGQVDVNAELPAANQVNLKSVSSHGR